MPDVTPLIRTQATWLARITVFELAISLILPRDLDTGEMAPVTLNTGEPVGAVTRTSACTLSAECRFRDRRLGDLVVDIIVDESTATGTHTIGLGRLR